MRQILFTVLLFIVTNSDVFREIYSGTFAKVVLAVLTLLWLGLILAPTFFFKKKGTKKLQMCYNGCVILTGFLASSFFTAGYKENRS